MLEAEEFLRADVFSSPPNEGLLSDDDSDDEEGVSAAHLSGPQLSATAEYRINYGNSVVNSLEFDASADEDAVTASPDVSDHDLSNLDSETEENTFLLLKPAATSLSWQKKKICNRHRLLILLLEVFLKILCHRQPSLTYTSMKKS